MREGWNIPASPRRIGVSVGLAAVFIALILALVASGDAVAPGPRNGAVEVVQTDHGARHLTELPPIAFSTARAALTGTRTVIDVNDRKRYQPFNGVGAALTNSAAYVLLGLLPYRIGRRVIEDVFGAHGINAGFTRVSIGGSDFDQNGTPFSDDDLPPGRTDPRLVHFSLRHDHYVIDALRLALAFHPGLRILASPWSPPAWMKTNGALNNRHDKGRLRPLYYGLYARYLVKWLLAYQQAGIPIYAISVQNEPNTPTGYPGGTLTVNQEATIIRRYLRPDLRSAGLGTRVYVGDASWDYEPWAERVISAAGGAAGVFWHCYMRSPVSMTGLHLRHRRVDQIVDECALNLVRESASQLVIEAARNWASGVMVWNLALNRDGGPKARNDVNCGGCIGSVTVNRSGDSGAGSPRAAEPPPGLTYHRELYELGQTGRFLEPAARRVYSSDSVRYDSESLRETAGLDDVAFVNPDGSLVLEVFNNTRSVMKVGVRARTVSFVFTIPGGATDTFRWRAASS